MGEKWAGAVGLQPEIPKSDRFLVVRFAMKFKDYYATFALPRDASQEDIKCAYRKLARKFHPDVSKDPDA